jgi:Rrf2 family transcriptional regulator, iron-sulfur cluster assembly transcription factor
MILSRSTEYAIRAMTFLATLPPGRLAGAKEIAEAEKIPMAFLWKILQLLTRRKLIRSFKGLRGGYELAQPAGMVTLNRIVEATDRSDRLDGCILGLPNCSDANACPLHETWKGLRTNMSAMLHQNTLADLAKVVQKRTNIQEL